jgi:hypothetical protein
MTVEVEEDEARPRADEAAGSRTISLAFIMEPPVPEDMFPGESECLLPSSCRAVTNLNGSRPSLTQQSQDMAFDPASQCNRSLYLPAHFSVILGWGPKQILHLPLWARPGARSVVSI